ncbi:MAG: UDPGP type 1 family protein, partial [Lentisphaerae bacterium]|nr:UDPGP type 1 family protein [Lentisphaerota bacterium]
MEPAEVIPSRELCAETALAAGEQALRQGSVGVLLVAGGQGSRLGFDGPKGAFPVGPVSDASLFEIHCRKILALERKYGSRIPLYIMTSLANDEATRAFFEKNDSFGMLSDGVRFFTQGMWPALMPDGAMVMDSPDHIFMSPDGHGGLLQALLKNGMLDDMKERGIETLFYFQVDNPLVEVADPGFLGLHLRADAEMSVKVCAKRGPSEKLGVVVRKEGRNAVVEYSELTDEEMTAKLPNGDLEYRFGSVAIHVFSREFLVREARSSLPIHLAHKKVAYCDESGSIVQPSEPNAFKFEKFIFDALPDAKRSVNVEFRREGEFSPVKNAEGEDSPATAQRDMIRKFASWLEACGVTVPRDAAGDPLYKIEIDPCYALGPEDLRDKLDPGLQIRGDLLLA